jgi:hypothetical protein
VEFTDSITPLKNKFLLFYLIFCFGQLFWLGKLVGQTFTSNQNGNWNTPGIWTRTNPNGCIILRNAPPPINAYAAICQVDVVINHTVFFDSPTASFGGGYFRILTVNGAGGNLTFQGSVDFNTAGSSLPAPNNVIFNLSNGGQINIPNGTLTLNRGGVINLSGNSTLLVRDLIIGDNSPIINVDEGSRLIVLNTTELKSGATLNISGGFETRDLILSSGGRVDLSNTSRTYISNNVNINNGQISSNGNSDIYVKGNFNQSGGGVYNGSGNSKAFILGVHNVNANNSLLLSGSSKFSVTGSTSSWSSGPTVTQSACYRSNNRIDGTGCAVCSEPYNTDGTFYVPEGVTSVTVEIIGAGGGGSTRTSNGRGGGGGGGAFSRSIVTVNPGEPIFINVGIGGSPNSAGEDSWIARTTTITDALALARGGSSAPANSQNRGNGGASTGIGDTQYLGGNGGTRTSGSNGGGGGSSAGSSSDGVNVGNSNAGGTAPLGGGSGGQGATSNSVSGFIGAFPGGGGGGGFRSSNPGGMAGNGGNGQVIITYSCPVEQSPCSRIISSGTTGDYTIIEYFCDGTWSPPEGLSEYEVLIVGGGGAGGRTFTEDKTKSGGGGGAVVSLSFSITNGITGSPVYNIDIGEGGNGSATDTNASQRDGRLSSFNNGTRYIAGGGAGGGSSGGSSLLLVNGRSGSQNSSGGGGGARFNKDLGSGGISDGMGFNGGGGNTSNGNDTNKSGGGGGGAAGNGADATIDGSNGGSGGSGKLTAINATSLRYGAGGGGGSGATPGSGGIGGGGSGGNEDATAKNGITNTGSGGGGAGGSSDVRTGGNGGSGVVIIRYQNFRILPVEFLYFNASFNSPIRTGELSWATAKEWENSHFEIERSINNIKSWTVIDQVAGAGYSDSPVAYSFQDGNLPVAGGIVYYRLKQVDFSGTYAYSDTKSIKVAAIKGKGAWIAYPNPSSEKNTVTVDLLNRSVYYDEPILIQISDIRGVSEVFTVNQIESISEVVNAYLDRSVSGVYILQLIWGNRSQQIKLLRE